MEPHHTATECHLPCGIIQCYQPPNTSKHSALNTSQKGWYLIYQPRRDGRLSWPRLLIMYWDSLPAHRRSPHLSTNPTVHGRESNSRPADHKSDALTTTPPSHLMTQYMHVKRYKTYFRMLLQQQWTLFKNCCSDNTIKSCQTTGCNWKLVREKKNGITWRLAWSCLYTQRRACSSAMFYPRQCLPLSLVQAVQY